MSESNSVRGSMDFLVGRIAAEAARQGVSLSDIERKMLYFSETGWTLPDIAQVNEAFDREYKQAAYEKKIARLIRQIRAAHRKENPQQFDAWTQAVGAIRKEDHYLLVIINQANAPESSSSHILRLALITAGGCCIALLAMLITSHC